MNHKTMICALLIGAVAMGGGCQQTCTGYKSSATIAPGEEKDTYMVEVKLSQLSAADGAEERVLIAPRVTVLAGESAAIQVSDEKLDGIFATVLVPQRQAGGTAKCSIHLKQNGRTKYLSTFELTLPYD
ncbi:MAG: hypothetical protein JSU94_20660 [Phycisphaerales bacterium]|nr:MAG: hypothetical protein JSU94_20660 [Phycisphaerales bacterium]